MENNIKIGSIVEMKKTHPCGSKDWEVIKLGVDLKLKCVGCGRIITISRIEFNKKMKKVKTN